MQKSKDFRGKNNMIAHHFECENKECRHRIEDESTKGIHICEKCGSEMFWDMKPFMKGATGDYCHVSDSLAMNPDQIAEHNVLFPGIKVHPDGRPEFNSVRQQSKYLEDIGFVKHPQKIKHKGETIA